VRETLFPIEIVVVPSSPWCSVFKCAFGVLLFLGNNELILARSPFILPLEQSYSLFPNFAPSSSPLPLALLRMLPPQAERLTRMESGKWSAPLFRLFSFPRSFPSFAIFSTHDRTTPCLSLVDVLTRGPWRPLTFLSYSPLLKSFGLRLSLPRKFSTPG